MAISVGIGQFAGNVPLTGYNVQKNTINVALRKSIPDNVVRSCVMQFGTKGLFGKARLRTVRHDRDNAIRKTYRAGKSSRRKPMPRRQTEFPRPALNAPQSEYVRVERDLVFSPPPLPSPLPTLATSSSPPAHSVRGKHGCVTPKEGPLVRASNNSVDSRRPMALPAIGSNDTLPTSADSNDHIPSLPSPFNGSGVVYARCSSATGPATCIHDLAIASSQHVAPAYQGYTPPDVRYATLVLAADRLRDDARHAAQLVGSRAIVDVSARTPAFTGEVNSRIHPPARSEHALSAPIGNGPIVHVDARTAESLLPMYGPAESLLPMYGPPQSQGTPYYPSPPSPPRLGYPFATLVDHESPSDQIPSPSDHFRVAGPGETHTWYGSQAASTALYVTGSEIRTPMTPYAAMPLSAQTLHDAPSIQDCAPLENGYTAGSLAGHLRERPVGPFPIAYHPFPTSSPDAAVFTPFPLSYNTPACRSITPSSSLANALGNYDTQPSCVAYHGVDGAVPSVHSVPSFGPTNASTRAPEVIWQMIPERDLAPVTGQTINAFSNETVGVDTNIDPNTICPRAECIGSQADCTQGFERYFDACDASWSWLPVVPHPSRRDLDSARGQRGDGAYSNVPSSSSPTTLSTPFLR